MITKEMLDNWFTYHAPDAEDLPKFAAIRVAAHQLATVLVEVTPPSADQSDALRKLREVVMTANAAIACKGK